jgi:hypothetical protein
MMPGMSSGAALRQLQQAHAGLRKAREMLKHVKEDPRAFPAVFTVAWESLTHAHRVMADLPREAIDHSVLTKQLALQRYATALLVRLRRLKRHENADSAALADQEDRFDDEDGED